MNNIAALGQMLFALGVMIALILLLAFWIKKAQQWQRPQGGQTLKILAHLSLGVKEKVVLVSVGEHQMLLGVTPNAINHLQTFEQPVVESSEESALEAPFAAVLKQYLGKNTSLSPKKSSGKSADDA